MAAPLVVVTVAVCNVPPDRVMVLLARNEVVTAKTPPESTKPSLLRMLLTVWVPEEWVTVMGDAGLRTTSSLVPGNAPVLQLLAVFQSPLPPTQETVAASTEFRNA